MGELIRKDDALAIERVRREIGKPALDEALVEMAIQAERASAYGTQRIVEQVQAEENEQVYMYRAAMAHELIQEMDNQILGVYREAAANARRVVREWGNR